VANTIEISKNKVKHLMVDSGLTVTALAERVGMSRQWCSEIINKEKAIRQSTADKLASSLGVDVTLIERT